MLDKSRTLKVDCVAYDLEDSVTPGKKAEARSNVRQLLSQPRADGISEQAVRINSVDSGYALDDLLEVVLHNALSLPPLETDYILSYSSKPPTSTPS